MAAFATGDPFDEDEMTTTCRRLATLHGDKDRLRIIKTIARNYTFTAAQATQLLGQAQFSQATVEAALLLWSRVAPKGDAALDTILKAFEWPEERDEFRQRIGDDKAAPAKAPAKAPPAKAAEEPRRAAPAAPAADPEATARRQALFAAAGGGGAMHAPAAAAPDASASGPATAKAKPGAAPDIQAFQHAKYVAAKIKEAEEATLARAFADAHLREISAGTKGFAAAQGATIADQYYEVGAASAGGGGGAGADAGAQTSHTAKKADRMPPPAAEGGSRRHDFSLAAAQALTRAEAERLGIDYSAREQCLSDPAFELHFGVTKEAFAALKKWKRNNLKKRLELF